jgi:hypothetical protein
MFEYLLDPKKLLTTYNEVIPEGWVILSRGDTCSTCECPLRCHEKVCPTCHTKFEPSEPLS